MQERGRPCWGTEEVRGLEGAGTCGVAFVPSLRPSGLLGPALHPATFAPPTNLPHPPRAVGQMPHTGIERDDAMTSFLLLSFLGAP